MVKKIFNYSELGYVLLLCCFYTNFNLYAEEKVTLHLKWYHQFQFAGYYAALEKGFYKEVGLDVELFESLVGIEGIHEKVIQKEGQYGIGSNELILERHLGKPVVVLAVIFQHSPSVLFIRKTSNTQSIHDLIGKRIMFTPRIDELKAYVKKEGISLESLKLIEHSFNPEDLIQGRVDAFSGYISTQGYDFKKSGIPLLVYSPRVAGIDFYGDNLFTSEIEIKNNPERVKEFRQASLKGWEYAMTHKEEIANLIYNKYSKRYSVERLLYEADQMTPLVLPVLVEMGYMNPGRWKHINDIYFELGMLPKNVDLKGFLYDPNPPPNYAFIYKILGAIVLLIGLIWFFQWHRLNKRYSENLVHIVEKRTEELKNSNASLILLNQDLSRTLKELTEAQDRLLASEKLATLGRLAAGMAHELNTPLGAIIASNQTLSHFLNSDFIQLADEIKELSEEDKNRFNIILQEGKKEITILDRKEEKRVKEDLRKKFPNLTPQLLVYILETGVYHLEKDISFLLESSKILEIFKLTSIILEAYQSNQIIFLASEKAKFVVSDLRGYLQQNEDPSERMTEIDLVVEFEKLLSLYRYNLTSRVTVVKKFLTDKKCLGNKNKLNQVWINLLNNALQAISYKGVLEIKIEALDPWVVVSFTDSGPGIPEKFQDKIFEPFFTTKSEGEGMGLGLNISRKLVLGMGGKIDFVTGDTGSTFRVWLPISDKKKT